MIRLGLNRLVYMFHMSNHLLVLYIMIILGDKLFHNCTVITHLISDGYTLLRNFANMIVYHQE